MTMTTARRDELAALMDWLHDHGEQLNYPPRDHRTESVADIRSAATLKARVLRPGGARWDCSQTVYALLGAIGCRMRFPWGSTATLLAELPEYNDARFAYIGGLVIYGGGTGHHVTMTRHRDVYHGNPAQFGNGSNEGPTILSMHTVAASQPAGVRLLSISHL